MRYPSEKSRPVSSAVNRLATGGSRACRASASDGPGERHPLQQVGQLGVVVPRVAVGGDVPTGVVVAGLPQRSEGLQPLDPPPVARPRVRPRVDDRGVRVGPGRLHAAELELVEHEAGPRLQGVVVVL